MTEPEPELGGGKAAPAQVGAEFAIAVMACIDARHAEREARGDEPGVDWDYFGSHYFERIERADARLGELLLPLLTASARATS